MPKKEVPLQQLARYLPNHTYEAVTAYLMHYKVHLTIARNRKSILGNYRAGLHARHHRISVNGNLNKYSFLITLLHELAHLLTFEQYGHRVAAHGKEWKQVYGRVLHQFMEKNIFPADIEAELQKILHNPGASSCAEEGLQRILYKYDEKKENSFLLEELPAGTFFKIQGGRIFQKGDRRSKRFNCVEISSGKIYIFSGIHEVVRVDVSSSHDSG